MGERTLRAACTERLTAKGFTQLSSACSANLAMVIKTKGIRKSNTIYTHTAQRIQIQIMTQTIARSLARNIVNDLKIETDGSLDHPNGSAAQTQMIIVVVYSFCQPNSADCRLSVSLLGALVMRAYYVGVNLGHKGERCVCSTICKLLILSLFPAICFNHLFITPQTQFFK